VSSCSYSLSSLKEIFLTVMPLPSGVMNEQDEGVISSLMLIFGLFGHFHTEVNPEMIPNLSRRAAKSLKIESLYYKIFIYF
jgi:hypothetical protein